MKFFVIIHCLFIASILFFNDGCCNDNNTTSLADKYVLTPTPSNTSPPGFYIPKNIDECFDELNKILHPNIQKYLKKPSFFNAHESSEIENFLSNINLPRMLRNYWGLWDKQSRLNQYFVELGVQHPDDMTQVVLTSYKRFLQNRPIELEGQIEFIKQFWLSADLPKPFIDKVNGGVVKAESSEYIQAENKVIHYGVHTVTGDEWAYEFGKGWYKVLEPRKSSNR